MIAYIAYKRLINFQYLQLPELVYECVPCLTTHNVLKHSKLFIVQNFPRKEFWIEEKIAFHARPQRFVYNDLQAKISRRNAKVSEFFKSYKKTSKISEVFQTLTDAPSSTKDIRGFIKHQKQHLERNGVKVLKFVWVLEMKRREDRSVHAHYHIVWVTERTKRIKLWYKSATYWGRRVNSEFVEKSAKAYLMKYLSKTDLLCANYRTFGKSVIRRESIDKNSLISQINSHYYINLSSEGSTWAQSKADAMTVPR